VLAARRVPKTWIARVSNAGSFATMNGGFARGRRLLYSLVLQRSCACKRARIVHGLHSVAICECWAVMLGMPSLPLTKDIVIKLQHQKRDEDNEQWPIIDKELHHRVPCSSADHQMLLLVFYGFATAVSEDSAGSVGERATARIAGALHVVLRLL